MINRLLFISILCFLYTLVSAQEKNFHIKGKVSGSEWSSVAPLINAYIQIKEKPETGFLTDSLGNFKIDRLKKGKYHITVSFIGFESRDTVVRLTDKSIDNLVFVLPLYYDKKRVSMKQARKEIRKGHPHLYAYTEDDKHTAFQAFYNKYQVGFSTYNPQLINNKEQHLNIPREVLIRYNRETFKYLDKTYGKDWQQEIPPGIIGFEEWIE